MTTYYFDDNSEDDHWAKQDFATDEEAIAWAEKRRAAFFSGGAILYVEDGPDDNPFRTIKEWT